MNPPPSMDPNETILPIFSIRHRSQREYITNLIFQCEPDMDSLKFEEFERFYTPSNGFEKRI